MKINLKILAFMLAFAMLAISSCKDDKEPEPLTKEEAQLVLNSVSSEMLTAMDEIMESPTVNTLSHLSSLMMIDEGYKSALLPLKNPFFLGEATKSYPVIGKFRSIKPLVTAKQEDNIFNIKGTLYWDFERSDWGWLDEPTDKLVIEFPSDASQTTNNATLTLSNYTEIMVGEEWFPKSFKITLLVGTEELLFVDYVADITATKLNSVDLLVRINPFELKVGLSVTTKSGGGVLVNFNHYIKRTAVTLTSSNLDISISGLSVINPFDMDDEADLIPETIKGFVQMGQVKTQLDLAVLDFISIYDNTTSSAAIVEAANSYLLFSFYTFPEGAKIGVIIWKWDASYGELVPYLKYNDGSEQILWEALNFDF